MSNDAKKGTQTSRRRFLKSAAVLTLALPTGSSILAACGDAATSTGTAATTANATATTAAATQTATTPPATTTTVSATATTAAATTQASAVSANVVKSSVAGVPDVYLSAPPVYKSSTSVPGRGSKVTFFLISYQSAPTPRAENKYWQELEKRLGVTWEPNLTPQSSYAEKFNVLVAGGDMSDLMFLWLEGAPEQRRLIQQGAFTDLTPYLTGDALKEYPNLAAFPAQIWKNSAIGGKIYGVPRPRYLTGNSLIMRKDWADKMGNPEPKNAQEFLKLMEDFTKKDPNGDGQPNTWGIGANQPTGAIGEAFANQFFLNMFRVPNNWKQDADGKLTYFIETPEYREALAYIRRLYEAGLYYPDSLTQSRQQLFDNFDAGKYGTYIDSITGITGRRGAIKKLNPQAELTMLAAPGHDGGKGSHWLNLGYFGMAAIPSKVGRDRERVKELLRVVNYLAAPFGSEEYNFLNFGIEGVNYEQKPDGTRVTIEQNSKNISELPRLASSLPVFYSANEPQYQLTVQKSASQMLEVAIPNPVVTGDSATWNTKGKELNQLLNDRVTRLITGRDPLTALDDLVKEWKNRGGNQVAQEFAASLKD